MLLHTKHKRPEAITEHLWTNTCNICTEIRKLTPRSNDGKIPNHVFVVPVHLLPTCTHWYAQNLCRIQGISNMLFAIYLVLSPNHTGLVHLIPSHGHPQFHVNFDDMFETTSKIMIYFHPNGKRKPVVSQITKPWNQIANITNWPIKIIQAISKKAWNEDSSYLTAHVKI